MTVKELIKQLEKMPKNLKIYLAYHDHGIYETGGCAGSVHFIDKAEMNEFENDKDFGHSDCFTRTPNKYVVIRP